MQGPIPSLVTLLPGIQHSISSIAIHRIDFLVCGHCEIACISAHMDNGPNGIRHSLNGL